MEGGAGVSERVRELGSESEGGREAMERGEGGGEGARGEDFKETKGGGVLYPKKSWGP